MPAFMILWNLVRNLWYGDALYYDFVELGQESLVR